MVVAAGSRESAMRLGSRLVRTRPRTTLSHTAVSASTSQLGLLRVAPSHTALQPRPLQPTTTSSSRRNFSSTPPAQASGARSGIFTALLVGIVGAGAYVAGAIYPPTLVTLVKPRDVPRAPDASTPEGVAWTADIEKQLHNLPLVKELLARGHIVPPQDDNIGQAAGANPSTRAADVRADDATSPDSQASQPQWIASRPYRKFNPDKLLHSLTAGTLRGPGKFACPPLVIAKTPAGAAAEGGSEGDAYTFIHLGRSLCGHNGIIHGGLLATICDEALARTAFFHLPSRVGVTGRLEIDYKAPTRADQFVVIKTQVEEAKGRKAVVTGSILDLEGNVLVNAKAIFIEPKFARFLDTSYVSDAMDAPWSKTKDDK